MKSSLTWVYTAVELSLMADLSLDESAIDPVLSQVRDGGYLYLILKKARSRANSLSEARGPRKGKERSEEKRTLVLALPYVTQRVADICEARCDQA